MRTIETVRMVINGHTKMKRQSYGTVIRSLYRKVTRLEVEVEELRRENQQLKGNGIN